MLKVIHTLVPQHACAVQYMSSFSIFTLKFTVPMAVDYTHSGYYNPKTHTHIMTDYCRVPKSQPRLEPSTSKLSKWHFDLLHHGI